MIYWYVYSSTLVCVNEYDDMNDFEVIINKWISHGMLVYLKGFKVSRFIIF
jgi:hypothetical protein